MALAGRGVLAIWNGIAAEAEDDFVAWHMREHIPERVGVPGFLRGRRYVAEAGAPKYFNFYETEAPETLLAPAYLERLNAPSDWTRRVVRHFRDTSRTVCSVAASLGTGDGAFVGTVRLAVRAGMGSLAGPVAAAVAEPAYAAPGIVAVHLLEGRADAGGPTAEKACATGRTKMRPGSSSSRPSTASRLSGLSRVPPRATPSRPWARRATRPTGASTGCNMP